jgi:hypothetical protein
LTTLALDVRDLNQLADDPGHAFKRACAEGTAPVRRVREAVEQHWAEMPDQTQAELLELAQRLREAPQKLRFRDRILAVMQIGWKFAFERNGGISEALTFGVEIARFMAAIDIQVRDQERRQRWLFDTAPVDVSACAQADGDQSPSYTFDELRARVIGQH